MCLIFLAFDSHPKYQLIAAANRDEFFARPTLPAAFWDDMPNVLAGRDLVGGGTWLGITTDGRFAAVTNYREVLTNQTAIKSRGDLIKNYLASNQSPNVYLSRVEDSKSDYAGFNLICGNVGKTPPPLAYYSNRSDAGIKMLTPAIYGLSNHLLDTDWPKVRRGKRHLTRSLQTGENLIDDLFEILTDRTTAVDTTLPNTGVGLDRERILSPAFVETENYGTRSSTVVLVEYSGRTVFIERNWIPAVSEKRFEFTIG